MLSKKHMEEKVVNRKMFLTTLGNIRFLPRQGLPFRNLSDVDSNFMQLLLLRSLDHLDIATWIKKKANKYSSPEVQITIRGVSMNVCQSRCFTIMADDAITYLTRNSLKSVSGGLVMILQTIRILLGYMRYRISLLTPSSMPSRIRYFT